MTAGILPSPVGMDRCLREGLIWYNLSWVTYLRIHVCVGIWMSLLVWCGVLGLFCADFRRRFVSLLSYQFRSFPPSVPLSILQHKNSKQSKSKRLPPLSLTHSPPPPPPSFPLPNSTSPTPLLFPPSPCVLWFICLWSFFLFVCWSVRPFVLFRLEVCLLIRLFIYVWSFACRSLC